MRTNAHPELHSRVSSLQGLHVTGLRSSTPKIPPGFETFHAQAALSLPETSPSQPTPPRRSSIVAPVLPAVPAVINQRISTPTSRTSTSPRSHDAATVSTQPEVTQIAEDVRQALKLEETNYGSSSSERARSPFARTKAATTTENPMSKKSQSVVVEEESTGRDSLKQAPHLERLDIPLEVASTTSDTLNMTEIASLPSVKPIASIPPPQPVEVIDTPVSSPATPATVTSEILRNSAPRPRTIRLTTSMIQKAEAVSAASSAADRSATMPISLQTRPERSRQPSVSSISRSRPSTPSVSDRFMSHDVSRAGSPPPGGIVGSAPSRVKSKNQSKKDRKEKAKKVGSTEPPSIQPSTSPAIEPVGPIIARQKKQKKKSSSVTDIPVKPKDNKEELNTFKIQAGEEITVATPPTPAAVAVSSRHESPPKELVSKDSKVEVKKLPKEDLAPTIKTKPNTSAVKSSYTVLDLCSDAARNPDDPSAVQKLLNANVTSMSKLLNEMIASGDLAKDHPWMANPSFNSAAYKLPPDNRKGQDYLNGNGYDAGDAFGYVYLPQKEKRALYAGHAVSVADRGDRKNDLLRRCLISPNGWVMRHLSAEESERVLELEERRTLYAEEFGELGIMNNLGALEDDDFINLNGGIEKLGRFGDRHGVCWVVNDEHNQDDNDDAGYDDIVDDDDEDLLDQDALSDETDEDLGLGLDPHGNSTRGIRNGNTMPGAWDPAFHASAAHDVGPNTLPPISGGLATVVNLRAMDPKALQARAKEKQKEVESTRKDADKADKLLGRKNKEFVRWRDGVLKA